MGKKEEKTKIKENNKTKNKIKNKEKFNIFLFKVTKNKNYFYS